MIMGAKIARRANRGKPHQTHTNPVKPTKNHPNPPKPSISRVGVSLAVFCLNIEKKKKRQNIDKKVKTRAETGCMVILGFAGFGWVLGGLGGLDLGRLVWWGGCEMVGLWVDGVGCVCMGRKWGFVWVFWGGFWCFMYLVKNSPPGSYLICEILSTFQNSQNFVNFHLSKNKGRDFKQSHPWLYSTTRLFNFNLIFIIRSNSLYPFPFGNKPSEHIISPFFRLIRKDFINQGGRF